MTRQTETYIFRFLLFAILLSMVYSINKNFENINDKLDSIQSDIKLIDQIEKNEIKIEIDEWELLYEAIIQHESKGDPKAVNKSSGAAGLIQIMPEGKGGYLDEANKPKKIYSNNDRFDPAKTREMWDKVQKRYNPQKDIHWAMKIHNPRGSIQYHIDILNLMDSIRNQIIVK